MYFAVVIESQIDFPVPLPLCDALSIFHIRRRKTGRRNDRIVNCVLVLRVCGVHRCQTQQARLAHVDIVIRIHLKEYLRTSG